MNIKDVIAVVTGGGSGLGEATVTRIAENGGKAVIIDLSEERGAVVVEKLGSDNVLFTKADVSNEEEVSQALSQAIEKFGQDQYRGQLCRNRTC